MTSKRFCLSLLCLFLLVASVQAEAGLFGRCGGGRRAARQASCSSQSYGYAVQSYQYQTAAPCAPCGQSAAPTYSANDLPPAHCYAPPTYAAPTYGYAQPAYAAPCAPCNQAAAAPMPTYQPVQMPANPAPAIYSTSRSTPPPRLSCADGSCRLR